MKKQLKTGIRCSYRGPIPSLYGLRFMVVQIEPEVMTWSELNQAVGSTNKGMTWQGSRTQFETEFVW